MTLLCRDTSLFLRPELAVYGSYSDETGYIVNMNLDLIKKKYSFGKVKGYMTTEAKYLFSICFLAGL